MINEQNINFLSQIWALFETVREGANYLTKHPESEQMRTDVSAGLCALCTHLLTISNQRDGACKEAAANTVSALHALIDRIKSGDAWDDACNQGLTLTTVLLTEQLSLEFLEAIRPEEYLSQELAQPIFAFCAAAPHQRSAIYQLLFELCNKSAYSMPLESYEWTICMMEEQPGLLSGEKMIHSDYIYRSAPQRTFDRCPVCGGAGTPYYRALSYQMANFEHPHLPAKLWMKCGNCGNLHTLQYPEELLTQAAHPQTVQPDPAKALTATRRENGAILSIWSTILNKLSNYTTGKDLLEVGIGEGCLLAVALEMGYRPDAVEIVRQSAQEVADILGIPIWNGDFLDYHPDKKYSVIVMGDVIEHVMAPEQALRNAYDLLADDGVLWLSTPNFEGSFTRLMKFKDPMWMEPYHISYFSYVGLRALAEKCGFTVREYQASNRYNGSMELILTKKG